MAAAELVNEHDDVHADIVIDRFHLAKHYLDTFEKLRKQELNQLNSNLAAAGYAQTCR